MLVLNRNNFVFNAKHFLQIKGTAIGTMVAPGFANNYVAWFERMFVYLYRHQPLLWFRFIDDIFLEFVEYLNSRDESH